MKYILCMICTAAVIFSCMPVSSAATGAAAEEYLEQSLEIYPDENSNETYITLNGVMPRNASAEAVDVTAEYSDSFNNTAANDTSRTSVVAAYDISITGKKGDFQPIEDAPILVEIIDPKISSDHVAGLWHITDDGRYEQVNNFAVKDGRISFYATGFSVYAVVNASEPEKVTSADDLTGPRAAAGFYLFCRLGSPAENNYFLSDVNAKNCLKETKDISKAAKWYFEKDPDGYKLYTYVGGVKKYLHSIPSNDYKDIELNDTAADVFDMEFIADDNSFFFHKTDSTMYLQHSKGGSGIRYFTDTGNPDYTHIGIIYADTVDYPEYIYRFDGKTYGLMQYPGGTLGYGLMADAENNSVDMTSLVVRSGQSSKILYVAQDCDITMFTFHSVTQNIYTLSAKIGGVAKYLCVSGNTLSLTDDIQNASPMTLDSNGKTVTLSCQGKSIGFYGSGFSMAKTNKKDTAQRLSLTKTSGLADDDYVCYSAEKISVSDAGDKSMVIVYTRVWNDAEKRYDFYAIDHDGTLYPCYERGDNIMWVGSRINTLQWEFTEYQYADGSPKYFYELYNPYSRKYIAPQLKDGQVLSDSTIGINMPGRCKGEYYTDIIAWDDMYYAYTGLTSDSENRNSIPIQRSKAATYYFAVVEKAVPNLTKVETIDNNEYGIKMKMIDFHSAKDPGGQNEFLGTTDTSSRPFSTQGLLSTDLGENGYPTAAATGRNLSELYSGANDVNHLFTESIYNESGYFEFDSCQNFATLYDENGQLTGNFTVYEELGTTDNTSKPTLKHGQFFPYDTITADRYATVNSQNLYGAVADIVDVTKGVLPESDPRKYERLHTVGNSPNYYNGMEMEASFVQTPDGRDNWGHDIIFEFTGDDDFWLYVDGELIIDLGGIHSALAGNVNFSTGDVTVEETKTNLREIFRSNYTSRKPDASDDEVNAYLAEYFRDGENIFKDHSSHTMKLFYMERGAGASNLHMRFNLSHSSPSKVTLAKQVSGSDNIDSELLEYPFQIWYKDDKDEIHLLKNTDSVSRVTYQESTRKTGYAESYTPPGSTAHYESVYFLNPGLVANIDFPEKTTEYCVIECGINTDVYDSVHVNGTSVTGTPVDGSINRRLFDSGWQTIPNRPSIVFDNHVKDGALRTLKFKKILYDQSGHKLTAEQDHTTFNFRLSLSKNSDDTPILANIYKYHVTNPEGFLCRWDVTAQTFVSVGTALADIETLTEPQREAVTFETSMNGAISQIPAGYTVHVPGLPVGTKFIVTERDNEIPLGYKLLSYEKVGDTYFVAEGDPENIGQIRENDSPSMLIKNQRGCGMEAQKIWTDTLCAASHDPVYTAVYYNKKNELVAGTVRQISHPNTSVRYYFDSLTPGTEWNKYSIYEVKVENPVISSDNTTVTGYDSITRLKDGDEINIGIVSKREVHDTFTYTVSYNEQTHDNFKTNTITNIREGGIVLTLYDMYTNEPLANGIFVLKQGDTELATFTSGPDGRIAVIYDFLHNTNYTVTETRPPAGYIGLPNSAVFSIDNSGIVTLSGNESQWQSWKNLNDGITAYIDFFNKPYTLQVIKTDGLTHEPLANAHFALYRGIEGIGGYVKDLSPIVGHHDLVSGSDGTIPLADTILSPGIYYLSEIIPPENYQPLDADILFTISESGNFIVNSEGHESFLETSGTNKVTYSLNVPNTPLAKLTVTKTVQGNFGNTNQNFTFTLNVEDASDYDVYEWSKNGIPQTSRLHSGGTFTLKHGESCTIIIPKGKTVTICENSENYTASFQLENADEETTNIKTFVLDGDMTLAVTNTLSGVLPTGIKTDMPLFVLLMTASVAAAIWLLYRKKIKDEEV